jgi:hypothetical protein
VPFTIQGPQLEIADGTYPAVLESVTTEPSKTPTIPGDVRRWTFLIEHDGKVEPMDALSSTGTGPKTKSYAWLTALIGREPKAGETIEDPTGARCLLQITHNEKGFPKVSNVMPYAEPQQTIEGLPR